MRDIRDGTSELGTPAMEAPEAGSAAVASATAPALASAHAPSAAAAVAAAAEDDSHEAAEDEEEAADADASAPTTFLFSADFPLMAQQDLDIIKLTARVRALVLCVLLVFFTNRHGKKVCCEKRDAVPDVACDARVWQLPV